MTTVSESMVAGRRVVPAADFCPECSSVVDVELEYTGEGEFVAEYRAVCPMCVGRQLPLRSTHFKRRCDMDRNWRLEKVQSVECILLREQYKTVASPGDS